MDNGLIFPYRLWCAHAELGDANRLTHAVCLRASDVASAGTEPVVGKRWGDAERQPNPGDGCPGVTV
jgi:hypothetical protein